jgi:hypothetical protein
MNSDKQKNSINFHNNNNNSINYFYCQSVAKSKVSWNLYKTITDMKKMKIVMSINMQNHCKK